MSELDNLAVSRTIVNAWNAHNPEDWLAYLADDYVYDSDSLPTTPITGRTALLSFFQTYVTAFPDIHFEVEQLLASGDFVVMRWKATGTHQGELNGIPPTGRHVATRGCAVTEFKNHKVIREWDYWDNVNMLRQLGVMPALT